VNRVEDAIKNIVDQLNVGEKPVTLLVQVFFYYLIGSNFFNIILIGVNVEPVKSWANPRNFIGSTKKHVVIYFSWKQGQLFQGINYINCICFCIIFLEGN